MSAGAAAAACERLAVAYRLWAMPSSLPSSSTADPDLVARAAGGDERAMAGLYDRYGQVLYGVAYRIVGERADADEVVLEAFAQAWRDASKFEAGRGSVAGWLTMIARSRALDLARARARRDRITTAAAGARPDAPLAMGEVRPDPSAAMEHAERRQEVRQALEALSAPQRQAIELAYYEGLSQSEIAERLEEPLGTIKTRIRLGMQKLRDALRPFYFEPGP
jgi:RNA polymerase sigma-70 factor (ECF subfamily)